MNCHIILGSYVDLDILSGVAVGCWWVGSDTPESCGM